MNTRFRFLLLGAAAAALLGTAGCNVYPRTPVLPYYGVAYNGTAAPVDTTYNGTAVDPAMKEGRSRAQSVLGLFSWGDASYETAARNGGIKTITNADCRLFNVLFLYSEYEIIVYGTAD